MKIEMKTMWLVEANLRVKEIVAMYDVESGSVVNYCQKESYSKGPANGEEWNTPFKYETFYATEEDAVNSRNRQWEEMKQTMPKVMEFIKRMEDMDDDVEEGDQLYFDREEYLGHYANSSDYIYYRDLYFEEQKISNALLQLLKNGIINVNAVSFRKDDVQYIKWCKVKGRDDNGNYHKKDYAKIILKDHTHVSTINKIEYEVIKKIFGDNKSNREFFKNVEKWEEK